MSRQDGKLRRAVNEVFGDALPVTTSDERPDGSPEDDAERDAWLRENVPPHHF